MTLETEDLLQSILDSLDRIDYIRPDDIPDIELYMEDVYKRQLLTSSVELDRHLVIPRIVHDLRHRSVAVF